MKQTAVEWLYNNLLLNPISIEDIEYNEAVFENAKEMFEKQQKGYSEEEVMTMLYCFHYDLVNSNIDTKEEWFEQFKNK